MIENHVKFVFFFAYQIGLIWNQCVCHVVCWLEVSFEFGRFTFLYLHGYGMEHFMNPKDSQNKQCVWAEPKCWAVKNLNSIFSLLNFDCRTQSESGTRINFNKNEQKVKRGGVDVQHRTFSRRTSTSHSHWPYQYRWITWLDRSFFSDVRCLFCCYCHSIGRNSITIKSNIELSPSIQ